jgi:hypothetical protein
LILADLRLTRKHLMRACLEARRILGLEAARTPVHLLVEEAEAREELEKVEGED